MRFHLSSEIPASMVLNRGPPRNKTSQLFAPRLVPCYRENPMARTIVGRFGCPCRVGSVPLQKWVVHGQHQHELLVGDLSCRVALDRRCLIFFLRIKGFHSSGNVITISGNNARNLVRGRTQPASSTLLCTSHMSESVTSYINIPLDLHNLNPSFLRQY